MVVAESVCNDNHLELIKMNKPFWEVNYLNNNISTFGIEPNVTIKEFINY